jgi:ribosome-associated protein
MKTEANLEIKKSLLNFLEVIKKGLRCRKLEKQKIPKSAIRKRIKNKKNVSQKKNRRKPNLD